MSISLSTIYGGLTLENPIVVGASNISTDVDHLVRLEEAGAAAIVYKSLFEEQLQLDKHQLDEMREYYSNIDTENSTFLPKVNPADPTEHFLRLKEARKHVKIPLIGSLNCINDETWLDFALKMEDTGIDALELNFYHNNIDFDIGSDEIEDKQLKTVELIKAAVRLPIFIKLSPYYTNALRLIKQMDKSGVGGFILFNRLFQPDINIQYEKHHYPYNFSNSTDNRLALRYAGLLHKNIRGSIISNTGILTGRDVIKMILAGADAVQIVSAIYKKGIPTITTIIEDIRNWMKKKGYESLDDFQGKLSKEKLPDPFTYKRAQYIDILMRSELFMKYHPREMDDELKSSAGDY
ncbi:MAG: dihydroorotate dehydrogenase-like protein [Candidatus Cyclobacteriaceae bacterium M2_1C_046]